MLNLLTPKEQNIVDLLMQGPIQKNAHRLCISYYTMRSGSFSPVF